MGGPESAREVSSAARIRAVAAFPACGPAQRRLLRQTFLLAALLDPPAPPQPGPYSSPQSGVWGRCRGRGRVWLASSAVPVAENVLGQCPVDWPGCPRPAGREGLRRGAPRARVEEVQRRTAVPGPPGRAHLPVEEPSGPSAALCLRLAHLPRPWSPGASAGSTQQSAASVFVCTT